MRSVAAFAAGLVAWIVVATVGDLAVHAAVQGYGEAEASLRATDFAANQASMPFTLEMMIARLLLGALATVVAGATCAWITRPGTRASWILGIVLVVFFVPVHVGLWQRFPVWYHLVFLAALLPCPLLGARPRSIGASDRYRISAGTAPRRSAGLTGGWPALFRISCASGETR